MDHRKTYQKIIHFTQTYGWSPEDVADFAQWLFERCLRLGKPFVATGLHHRIVDYRRHIDGDKKHKTTSVKRSLIYYEALKEYHWSVEFEDSEIYRHARLSEEVRTLPQLQRAAIILTRRWGMTLSEIAFVLGIRAAQVEALIQDATTHSP